MLWTYFLSQNFRSSLCVVGLFLVGAGAGAASDAPTPSGGVLQSFGSLIAKTMTAMARRAKAAEWIGDCDNLFMLPFPTVRAQENLDAF